MCRASATTIRSCLAWSFSRNGSVARRFPSKMQGFEPFRKAAQSLGVSENGSNIKAKLVFCDRVRIDGKRLKINAEPGQHDGGQIALIDRRSSLACQEYAGRHPV